MFKIFSGIVSGLKSLFVSTPESATGTVPTKTRMTGIIVVMLLMVGVFFAGKYSAPAKIVTKTEIQTQIQTQIQYKDRIVIQKVYVKDTNEHKTIAASTQEVINPNGQKVITTNTTTSFSENTQTQVNQSKTDTVAQTTNQTLNQTVVSTKTVTNSQPNWSVGLLGGINVAHLNLNASLKSQPFIYGLEVDRRIVAGFSLGVFGLNDGDIGIKASYRF